MDGNQKSGVFIIDDDEVITGLLSELLTNYGLDVTVCNDSEAALNAFTEISDSLRLVMVDLVMPGLNGTEVISQLRELNPTVKIILMSGYIQDGTEDYWQDFGVDCVLKKPFRLAELYSAVKSDRE